MFKLSRRKGSSLWQIRKRWPADVSSILPGEFTKSTGESDRRRAQELLPIIAAEYEARVKAARDRLADNTQRDLSAAEIRRLAANFYRDALPHYTPSKPLAPMEHRALVETTKGRIETLDEMRKRREYGPVAAITRGLIDREGLPVPDESPSRFALEALVMEAFIELHRGALARLDGASDYTPTAPAVAELVETRADQGRTVSRLIDAHESANKARWSKSSLSAKAPVARLLRDTIGEREVASLTREDARRVFEVVQALPKGLGKIACLRGLPVPAAVELAKTMGLPTIGPATINSGYMVHIAALFRWAQQEGWAARNEFTGLSVHDPVPARDKRDPFSPSDLSAIFSAAPWGAFDPAIVATPGRYWVPLIALFSGMRLGEAAGLRIVDIGVIEGVDVFQIRPHELRGLKTAESRRDVPIHPELKRLGFLDFVASRGKAGATDDLLFPDGRANARRQAGVYIGRWFLSLLGERGISGTKLGMHSFRHNFEDRLKTIGLHGTSLGLSLAGRSLGGSAAIYGSGHPINAARDAIAGIQYPGLDLKHVWPR